MPVKPPTYQLPLLDLPEPDDNGGWATPQEAALREVEARTHFESGERPEWYDEYESLINHGWPFRVAMYIAWAATPAGDDRYPKTLLDLAHLMGLRSTRAIFTWRSKNEAIDSQVAILQAAPLFKHRAGIFAATIKTATEPGYRNTAERRLAYQLMGDLDPEGNVAVNVALSGDDLAKARQQAQDWERDRFGDDDPTAPPVAGASE